MLGLAFLTQHSVFSKTPTKLPHIHSRAPGREYCSSLHPMAASATRSFSSCRIASIRSLLKPVHRVHPAKLALQFRTARGCRSASPQAASVHVPTTSEEVFSDDIKGIVCYRSETGEVICEGLDEGPHFYPSSGSKVLPSSIYMPDIQAASTLPIFGESMHDICTRHYMGSMFCEGRDEG